MLLVRSLSFLTSGAWRHGGRRVNWARVAGVIYDKFDGEFASRVINGEVTSVIVLLCRFSDAGMTRLSTRCGGRRPKSAKARNRGKWGTGGAAGLWRFSRGT